jgi:hypothetical protein
LLKAEKNKRVRVLVELIELAEEDQGVDFFERRN